MTAAASSPASTCLTRCCLAANSRCAFAKALHYLPEHASTPCPLVPSAATAQTVLPLAASWHRASSSSDQKQSCRCVKVCSDPVPALRPPNPGSSSWAYAAMADVASTSPTHDAFAQEVLQKSRCFRRQYSPGRLQAVIGSSSRPH